MSYRSIEKTNSDRIKDIEQSHPENHQTQSIQNNSFGEDTEIPLKNKKKTHNKDSAF